MAEKTNEEKTKEMQIVEIIEEPKTVSMSVEERMKIEREIQLGERDTLIDGRKIKDVQEENLKIQEKQEKERSILVNQEAPDKLEEKVRLNSVAGVITEVPTKKEEKQAEKAAELGVPVGTITDLPKNFPHREKLIAAGVTHEAIKRYVYDDYIAIGLNDQEAREAVQYAIDKADKN